MAIPDRLRLEFPLKLLALTILLAGCGATGKAPPSSSAGAADKRALITVPANGAAKLTVTTPAFTDGSDIPFENTQYKGNTFPGLSWSAGPAGTMSYVIILQDVDARPRGSTEPYLHWTMGNIPASVTTLDAGMTTLPAGSLYGPNYRGANQPYAGPRTPPGPKHHYHFQVFALDSVLSAEAFASYEALLGAMKGHVVASGEVVGLGQVMPAG